MALSLHRTVPVARSGEEEDIDIHRLFSETDGKDHLWRWTEQWIPHTAWYLIAVAARGLS